MLLPKSPLTTVKRVDLEVSSTEVKEPQLANRKPLYIKFLLLPILVILVYFEQKWLSHSSLFGTPFNNAQLESLDFYYNITQPRFSCAMRAGQPISHAGLVGIRGDSEETPRRAFFWYFEAENNSKDAPVVLFIGGGPGSSVLLSAGRGHSPCLITDGAVPEFSPHSWTEHFNVLLLEHSIGVGYSHGARVDSSHEAALDAYDGLQKVFKLFPELVGNQLVISGGSYGSIYIPHLASLIQSNNKAILQGTTIKGLLSVNLEALMLTGPLSDPLVYSEWLLEYRCSLHKLYNSTMCAEMYSNMPICLERIELAYQFPDVHHRSLALKACFKYLNTPPDDGVLLQNIKRSCKDPDPRACYPLFDWTEAFFNKESTKEAFGLAKDHQYIALNPQVTNDFTESGDIIQPHQELFNPLLEDGIRLLHYIGAHDAVCPWPGVLSTLKQLKSPHQVAFLTATDVPWYSGLDQRVTIRQVGANAGDFTFMILDGTGHFVSADAPKLEKMIAEHWIANKAFVNATGFDMI